MARVLSAVASLAVGVGAFVTSWGIDVLVERDRADRQRDREADPDWCPTCDDVQREWDWHYSTCPRQDEQEDNPRWPGAARWKAVRDEW